MNYYIITYKAFVDCVPITGHVGVISKTTDYFPNKHKQMLRSYYEQLHPGTKIVILIYAKKVCQDEYYACSAGFLRLQGSEVGKS